MADLLELAKRCEDIKRGSGHLDYLIWQALGLRGDIDYYTTSLDAAMTLVPDECQWRVDTHHNIAGVFHYWLDQHEGPSMTEYAGEGYSLPLALCAAALRAHHALNNNVD